MALGLWAQAPPIWSVAQAQQALEPARKVLCLERNPHGTLKGTLSGTLKGALTGTLMEPLKTHFSGPQNPIPIIKAPIL